MAAKITRWWDQLAESSEAPLSGEGTVVVGWKLCLGTESPAKTRNLASLPCFSHSFAHRHWRNKTLRSNSLSCIIQLWCSACQSIIATSLYLSRGDRVALSWTHLSTPQSFQNWHMDTGNVVAWGWSCAISRRVLQRLVDSHSLGNTALQSQPIPATIFSIVNCFVVVDAEQVRISAARLVITWR